MGTAWSYCREQIAIRYYGPTEDYRLIGPYEEGNKGKRLHLVVSTEEHNRIPGRRPGCTWEEGALIRDRLTNRRYLVRSAPCWDPPYEHECHCDLEARLINDIS